MRFAFWRSTPSRRLIPVTPACRWVQLACERHLRDLERSAADPSWPWEFDERLADKPCAFIELKAGASVSAEDIVAHCRQHLARFKVPRAVVFGELPKTATGKIQKFELRKQAGSATAIDV